MPSSPVEPPPPARFFVPRSHRLYTVVDSEAAAERMLHELGVGTGGAGAWVYTGEAGTGALDPDAAAGGTRLFSWLFSHNVEFLRTLSRTVRAGDVVVAVPAPNLRTADELARRLRQAGVEVLAYTAHGNFVPLTP